MPQYSLLIKAIFRMLYPEIAAYLDKYLEEHPEVSKKIERILYILIWAIIFINIFIYIPGVYFLEYSFNYCAWNMSELCWYLLIPIIVLTILLLIELIMYRINFRIIRKENVNETIVLIFDKLSPFITFMGKMLLCFMFLSLVMCFLLICILYPMDKEYITNCSSNISLAPEMLFDTKAKKIFRKKQTVEYTSNISDYFMNNWTPPILDKEKYALVILRISKSGKLLQYKMEESSGIEQFDKSVTDAVKSVDSFKPLPECLKTEYIDFLFGFDGFKHKKSVAHLQNLCKTCKNPYKHDENFR